MQGEPQSLYADDESHPIPSLYACDVNAVKKTGGSELVVVVAAPLRADERSQKRLLMKLENYLRFINSAEFAAESGPPSVANTSIVVNINNDSDPGIFVLLDKCRPWVEANHASLVVERVLNPMSTTSSNA